MRRRELLKLGAGGLAGLMLTAMPGHAASLADQFAAELKSAGYQDIKIARTLLGRMRVVGVRGDYKREIVFDPRTGEVLRDLTVTIGTGFGWGGGSSGGSTGSSGSSSSGSSSSGSSDDDDEEDDDNSGSDDDGSDDSGGGDDDDSEDH